MDESEFSGSTWQNRVFSFFIIASLIPLISYSSLQLSGFCWAQKRWLSGDEMVAIALAPHLAAEKMAIESGAPNKRTFRMVKQMQYTDQAEFLKLNPDCCSVNGKPAERIAPENYGPNFTSTVRIDYLLRYRDGMGRKQTSRLKFTDKVGKCGSLVL